MDVAFWGKLATSFAVGGVWVAMSTVIAERRGSRIGGLVAGFPSTVAVALFFIGLTQSPLAAARATTVMPLAQGCNGLFVLTFLWLAGRGLWPALAGALSAWGFLAASLLVLDVRSFAASLAGWAALSIVALFLAGKALRARSVAGRRVRHSRSQLVGRAVFGGTIIASAVLASKFAGPLLGGILAAFPAVFLSTLVITYRAGGPDFARAVGQSLLVGGVVNVGLYAIAVRLAYPRTGLWPGTAIALLFALGTTAATYGFLKKRRGPHLGSNR